MEVFDSVIGFLPEAKESAPTDLDGVIPRRRLELEGGEHLLEVPVFGLLPLPVLGQLVLEKVGGGGGGAPPAGGGGGGCHLVGRRVGSGARFN